VSPAIPFASLLYPIKYDTIGGNTFMRYAVRLCPPQRRIPAMCRPTTNIQIIFRNQAVFQALSHSPITYSHSTTSFILNLARNLQLKIILPHFISKHHPLSVPLFHLIFVSIEISSLTVYQWSPLRLPKRIQRSFLPKRPRSTRSRSQR